MLRVVLMANWGLGFELLKTLHAMNNVKIMAVVTQFDNESGDEWFNSVHNLAIKNGYTILDQETTSFEKLREYISSAEIDLMVCHSFMKVIPESIFSAPRLGCINIHPSLLPRHRGPSPTYWVLKNGEKETGLTCHYIDKGIDTGAIISQVRVPVEPNDNIGSIIEKQKLVLERLVTDAINSLLDPHFSPIIQDEALATHAPRPGSGKGA
jgi:methionyl-tRNA formyltransferase